MPSILSANTLSSGYDVANSVRFDDGSNCQMRRAGVSGGNQDKFTLSMWIKRSAISTDHPRLFTSVASNDDRFEIYFENTDELHIEGVDNGTATLNLVTSRKFRDVSAWYHILLAVDTGQGTEANRAKLYINGVLETAFGTSTRPDQDGNIGINTNSFPIQIGEAASYGVDFDGYFAEIVFLDGTQSANTDLGEFDSDSGIWKPIDVEGLSSSKGNNGFYLDFEASGNLGNDVFGGTDFSEANLAATDQSTDTCTNNFCVINQLVNGTKNNSRNPTLSEGNTFLTNTSGAWMNCFSSFAVNSGKWYFEIKPTLHGTSYVHAGIYAVDDWQNESSGWPNFGGAANSWSYDSDGNIVNNDENEDTNPDTYTTNDIIGIAVDLDNNKFYAYKNNSLQISGGSTITANTEYYFGGMGYNSNIGFNFGNPPYANSSDAADANGYGAFEFAPPSGYYSINTKNLAEYG
jgi:hypothetical protein